MICPACGSENAETAKFCSECGMSLVAAAAESREERKVVTCLFCDLVGFTSRAERMDPEDVRRLLQPYHARVRSELERFGGTVEKFIGDAVVAVFGAPVAHEDDPERAVRAALAVRDALADDDLDIRIGITTGEALISLGARPERGEGIATGDVVNTAARLQAAAPTGGVLVDETTRRATERAIEYAEPTSIEAKGKAEPIAVWEVLRARARVAVERVGGAPLIGREQELTLLRETLARVIREREPQLVTLVGVPGIGKSRLVFELFQSIESGSYGLVFWRHGRSPPYGQGVTFWALGEMVKAQAGILESDAPTQAGEKLRQAVATFVDDVADAAWFERHLRPLAGLETDETWTGDRRDEAFAARRRFLEAIAEARPLVLVFEDLHWADEALLDFVDYLLEWANGVPILVLATARPELLTRRPGWGGGKVNSSTILLSPLSEEETARLLHALLGQSAIDAVLQARLLEHAGGNPLYAEEFTRMLVSRPGERVLPETVQGIIAARLDTLPAEEKELLQDAAVLGRVFWLGALGGERWTLEERLHALVRKEFVTRNRRSSVAGEEEYVFRHALVRDVAYEQIPKAERAERHRAAAEWIESLGRAEDHAEPLAHHYVAALEYARNSGQDEGALAERGRLALREAGDRALALSAFTAAENYYRLALELWPSDDPERPELLLRLARARNVLGDERRERSLVEARDALLASGRVELAAETDALLAEVWWFRGERDRCDFFLERAASAVKGLAPSAAKAYVLSQAARYRMLAGEDEEAIAQGKQALAMAEDLGLDELRAHALNNIGTSRVNLGDRDGVALIEEAAALALAIRSPEAARAFVNLGAVNASLGDFRRATGQFAEAIRVGEELGALPTARWAHVGVVGTLLWLGRWDEGLRWAEAYLEGSEDEFAGAELNIRRHRARVLLARDDVEGALDDVSRVLDGIRQMKDPQSVMPALGMAARVYLEVGREDEARRIAAELVDFANRSPDWRLVDLAFVAERLGYSDELRSLLEQLPRTRWRAANLALVSGEYETAADLFFEIGAIFAEADARILAVEKLDAEGRRSEAEQQLARALDFYRSVGATRRIRECEAVLPAAS